MSEDVTDKVSLVGSKNYEEMTLPELVKAITDGMLACNTSHCEFTISGGNQARTKNFELRFKVDLVHITN